MNLLLQLYKDRFTINEKINVKSYIRPQYNKYYVVSQISNEPSIPYSTFKVIFNRKYKFLD